MLLSPSDPLLSGLGLNSTELSSAIALAQAMAEGVNGAGRPLGKRALQSVIRLTNGVGFVPVLPIDTDADFIVDYRVEDLLGRSTFSSGNAFSFGQLASTGWLRHGHRGVDQWELMNESSYVLNPSSGEIIVDLVQNVATPLSQIPSAEIRVTYTGGFDFSAESDDPLVVQMRAALVSLIRSNTALDSGMSRFELDDFYNVTLDAKNVGSVQDNALSIFKSLRHTSVI